MAEFRFNDLFAREGSDPEIALEVQSPQLYPELGDGSVKWSTLRCMKFDTEPKEIYLGPSDLFGYGEMTAILDGTCPWLSTTVPAYPSSGSYDLPVFGINQSVVAVDLESWDSVKSLYR